MKTALVGCLLWLTLGLAGASTRVLSGPLYRSGDSAFPSHPDGGYSMTLSGTTLSYSVSTGLVAMPITAADYGILLGGAGGSISMPFIWHLYTGMSGCHPSYGPERAITYNLPAPGTNLPFIELGNICQAYFELSVFSGALELNLDQLLAFSRPDFSVAVWPLGLSGRTSPEIITLVPEPSVGVLLGFIAVARGSRRQRPSLAHQSRLPNAVAGAASVTLSKCNATRVVPLSARPGAPSA